MRMENTDRSRPTAVVATRGASLAKGPRSQAPELRPDIRVQPVPRSVTAVRSTLNLWDMRQSSVFAVLFTYLLNYLK